MKVRIEFGGWTKAPTDMEWLHPNGYYNYLLYAANGIIVHRSEWCDSNEVIPEGEYDLPDEMFAYDNPEWDKEIEEIYE